MRQRDTSPRLPTSRSHASHMVKREVDMPGPIFPVRRDRRGNYAIILGLSVPVLLGVTAVAVDLSYQKVVRAELQGASDIAATAGAAELDGTYEGLVRAKNAAMRASARNNAHGSLVPLQPGDIEFGYWDREGWGWVTSDDPVLVDSMRVAVRHERIGTSFASIAFAESEVSAGAGSTAYRPPDSPAGAVSCYLPLGVPDCIFEQHSREELSQLRLKLNPAGVDNVGWARAHESPNANWIKDQIANCQQDGMVQVGELAWLQNGMVNSAPPELVAAMKDSDLTWDVEAWGPLPPQNDMSAMGGHYGKIIEGPIIVFDGTDEYCDGSGDGGFNQAETIVGFAWAVVYDVRRQGGAEEKNIWVKLDPYADQVIGHIPGGLVDAGVDYDEPVVLVK